MAIDEEFQGWEIEGGTEIVDANGFEVAEVPETAILPNWHKKYPHYTHWSEGVNGETCIHRTVEEAERITRLLHAAPEMLDALRKRETACQCLDDSEGTKPCDLCQWTWKLLERIEGGDE